jgi:hypothetical protein
MRQRRRNHRGGDVPGSCIPDTVESRLAPGDWEEPVTELTPEQASEKCQKHLVAGLRLIRPAERVPPIAKALKEVEAREKRQHQSAEPDARH